MMVTVLVYLVVFLGGGVLGYIVHYLMYEQSGAIHTTTQHNRDLRRDNDDLTQQYQSIAQENILLRKEAQKVLDDNKEFQDIIAQLSVYARRMHECQTYVKKLDALTRVYEDDMPDRIATVSDAASHNHRVRETPAFVGDAGEVGSASNASDNHESDESSADTDDQAPQTYRPMDDSPSRKIF